MLEKRENENNFEYGLRLLVGKMEGQYKDIDWSEIIEILNLDIHRDTLRKSFTGKFGGYDIYKYFIENNINKNISLEIDELRKEKIAFQDQKREYNKYLRTHARMENIIEKLKNDITSFEPFNLKVSSLNQNHFVEASLLLSDWHIGLETDNYWNKFNFEIAKERVSSLLNNTIEICLKHNVSQLNIELIGDFISGLIHFGTRIESEENTSQQVIFCSELLSNFIYELAKNLSNVKINIYCTVGNHGRIVANKSESIVSENFEKIIFYIMKIKLKDIENINIITDNIDETFGMYELQNGKKIIYSHGDCDKILNATRNYEKIMKEHIFEVHLGHFHNFNERTDGFSTVVVNGSLSGVDSFAKNLRLCSTPLQVLRIYEKNNICNYKINLQ